MKIVLLMLALFGTLAAYTPPPRALVTVTGLIEKNGEPFDNILITFGDAYYQRMDWRSPKLLLENIPAGIYSYTVYIADSVRGNYMFSGRQIDLRTSALLPALDFSDKRAVRENNPIPCDQGKPYSIELIRFNLDDDNLRNIKLEKSFLMFGGSDWQKDIDENMQWIVERYGKYPKYSNYVLVEGYATTNECGGDAKKQLALSVSRAKHVVNYITENYQIDHSRFLVFGRGGGFVKNIMNPVDGENRRVVITYDIMYR
ncbi:MAG: OmpA family protein [Spirochaetes bacterium]|nr:OmpA family protein [Spirochaetota bacterium]